MALSQSENAELKKTGIPEKSSTTTLRLVTFNVNGVKTIKNYSPWNEMKDYNQMLNHMNADIITFQELKLQPSDVDHSLAFLDNYRSFISVPKTKKGYSGVGVFVRSPTEDDDPRTQRLLNVIRAEEGISGELNIPGLKGALTYREAGLSDDPAIEGLSIGGYPESTLPSREFGLQIDSEGRSVILEFDNNLVVISVYCPANSGATEDGELFRISFLRCLFERARNLKALGKNVVIMGDINISRDVIDNDEFMRQGVRNGILRIPAISDDDGSKFEKLNPEEVEDFKTSTDARATLDEVLVEDTETKRKILYDVVRKLNGRKMKMYTCWNTLKNLRPQNMGSRIDLILATSGIHKAAISAGIWPHIMGSDHCPVYADFEIKNFEPGVKDEVVKPQPHKFEARYSFKVNQERTIASFFSAKVSTESSSESSTSSPNHEVQEIPISLKEQTNNLPKRRLAPPPNRGKKTKIEASSGQRSIQSFFGRK
ncbi:unnamed protein product [Kuraishia capsulata CBS 1993]|uniref:Endonuclease/exonuclease/phosphatase domain-containing protein n=1 Tax=Kuraishia capsulata CBS 1993 TaxID=1382522 RepID=W6MQK2_9ASCO|nr:uncharacterized protein KUCA_T00004952001 [Kuraishia capsulata CBS 1993]CDK28966.1 unnamed protein product [Kuraishia capsulata CBS 1993]